MYRTNTAAACAVLACWYPKGEMRRGSKAKWGTWLYRPWPVDRCTLTAFTSGKRVSPVESRCQERTARSWLDSLPLPLARRTHPVCCSFWSQNRWMPHRTHLNSEKKTSNKNAGWDWQGNKKLGSRYGTELCVERTLSRIRIPVWCNRFLLSYLRSIFYVVGVRYYFKILQYVDLSSLVLFSSSRIASLLCEVDSLFTHGALHRPAVTGRLHASTTCYLRKPTTLRNPGWVASKQGDYVRKHALLRTSKTKEPNVDVRLTLRGTVFIVAFAASLNYDLL